MISDWTFKVKSLLVLLEVTKKDGHFGRYDARVGRASGDVCRDGVVRPWVRQHEME